MCLGLGHVGIATIEWLGLSAVAAALELREDQWEVEACVVACDHSTCMQEATDE